jgi:hypothetical protein
MRLAIAIIAQKLGLVSNSTIRISKPLQNLFLTFNNAVAVLQIGVPLCINGHPTLLILPNKKLAAQKAKNYFCTRVKKAGGAELQGIPLLCWRIALIQSDPRSW